MRPAIAVLSARLAAGLLLGQEAPHSAGDADEGLRLYTAYCAACHGVEGGSVAGVDLKRGQFRRVASDEDLARIVTQGIPGAAMPPASFTPVQVSHVVAYVRSLKAAPVSPAIDGDAARGKQIVEGKGGCLNCHQVAGKGSRVGPDLTEVGRLRSAAALKSSILEPNRTVLPQHRYVRAATLGGRAVYGRRLNEDTLTIQILDSNEELLSLPKSSLREYTVLKTSPMPSYEGQLTPQELADLLSYLISLK